MKLATRLALAMLFIASFTNCNSTHNTADSDRHISASTDDIFTLFNEFKDFDNLSNSNPSLDFSPSVIEKRQQTLKLFQQRLAQIDVSSWSIAEQIDYHLVRATMNGLDFQFRVLRPWARDPGFYDTKLYGSRLFGANLPLTGDQIEELRESLQAIPEILNRAQEYLTEPVGEYAVLAVRWKDAEEIAVFQGLTTRLAVHHPELVPAAEKALQAVLDYRNWLDESSDTMGGSIGVGTENYSWWLKNVSLLPYTWEECVTIVQREFDRTWTFLKLEEHRNRDIPELEPVTSEVEYHKKWNAGEEHLLNFLDKEEIYTVPDYLVPVGRQAWSESFERRGPLPGFFPQCEDRDPFGQLCHEFAGHHYDRLRFERDNRPIRGSRLSYRVSQVRSEGFATWIEETLMNAGLFDSLPRGRGKEITYIMANYRAVRARGDLKLHSNENSLLQTVAHDSQWSPYGWASEDDPLIWDHMQQVSRFPGSDLSYLIGKVQIDKLLSDRAHQLGKDFNLRDFMDEFLDSGSIPIALIRWEMTGLDDEIKKLW
jgi:hypothetical protein